MTAQQHAHRLVVIAAATTLAGDARAAAAAATTGSSEWQFYRGVEDAALHVLRPEMATVHDDPSWLDREDRAFRDGFLEAQLLLTTVGSADAPPMRVRLPEPRIPPPR